jgi:hypothetical protein
MAGLILMLIVLGVMVLFGLGEKKERWPGEHKMQADFNRAAAFWNASDVRMRVKLLNGIHREDDPQVFQAYVQARWNALPESLQLKLMGAVLVYRENPEFFE